MDLSKLYALLNAVPIVTGGAQAVMDAIKYGNTTFAQAVADRINAPRHALSWDDIFDGKDEGLPHFEIPSRDFEPLPERFKFEIPEVNDTGEESLWDYNAHNWHYDDEPGGGGGRTSAPSGKLLPVVH